MLTSATAAAEAAAAAVSSSSAAAATTTAAIARRERCRRCAGEGTVQCQKCRGVPIKRRKNPVPLKTIVGSSWTALDKVLSWNHFHVKSRHDIASSGGKDAKFLEMAATCQPETVIWVDSRCLKDSRRWRPGWLRKEQVEIKADENDSDTSLDHKTMQVCKDCRGKGAEPCLLCAGYNVIDI